MAQGDTPANPLPATTSKVEWKVKAATLATYVSGVVGLAIVNAATDDNNKLLTDALPDWLEPFVLPVVPAVAAFIAGYSARHQWRRDAGQATAAS
jgi:hypothetical protein